jgi:ABC-type Na+ efflux pump permease subunit
MGNWTTKKILAIGSMFFVFGILFLLMFIEIPVNNREIFNTTFSMIIGGSIVLAFSYYFGDSDRVKPNNDEKYESEEN